jgi:hypothetical protein
MKQVDDNEELMRRFIVEIEQEQSLKREKMRRATLPFCVRKKMRLLSRQKKKKKWDEA